MNTVAKGYKAERLCQLALIKDGYLTWKTMRHRFLDLDLFGIFDVYGVRKSDRSRVGVQVKRIGKNSHFSVNFVMNDVGRAGISIGDYVRDYALENESVEIWAYFDGRWRGRGKNKKFVDAYRERWKIIYNGREPQAMFNGN